MLRYPFGDFVEECKEYAVTEILFTCDHRDQTVHVRMGCVHTVLGIRYRIDGVLTWEFSSIISSCLVLISFLWLKNNYYCFHLDPIATVS